MYDLKNYPNFTLVGIKDSVVFLSNDGTLLHKIVIAKNIRADATKPKEDGGENEIVPPLAAYVVSLEYCTASKVLAISVSDKTVQCHQITETDGKLVSAILGDSVQTARTIVCMKFAPKHGVLLGCDKSDCFEFDPTGKANKQPKWIFGHMSQILGMAVSEDERYIITCDRDEKIKVTSFPDCHNIVNYCMGHLEYVAGLELLAPNSLLSVSGDKTLRLWNYTEGKETLNHTLQDPAVGVTLCRMSKGNEFLCAARSFVDNKIETLQINPDDTTCVPCETLSVDNHLTILNAVLNSSLELIVLAIDKESKQVKFMVYAYVSSSRRFEECADHALQKNLQNVFSDSTIEQGRDYSTLFKNSIDNLSDYFERKKIKIGTKKAK